jgi:hypothetical protein
MEPLDVMIGAGETRFELRGDELEYHASCGSVGDLLNTSAVLQFLLPAMLNVTFPDPPFVIRIAGTVADVPFTWIHKDAHQAFRVVTTESMEQAFADACKRMALIEGIRNRRLAAALHYFHAACRLKVAGVSDWEFMAEAVLNLAKVLQILFGNDMDQVRDGLRGLNYENDEIEHDAIPILVLRNHFDVGHPKLSQLTADQLRVIHRFLEHAEEWMRDLLQDVMSGLEAGDVALRDHGGLLPDADEQRRINRLVESLGKHLDDERASRQATSGDNGT